MTEVWLRPTAGPLRPRGSLRLYRRRWWPRRSERSRVRPPPLLVAPRHRFGWVRGRRQGMLLSLPHAHRPESRAATRHSGGGFVERRRSPAGQRRPRQQPPPSAGDSRRRWRWRQQRLAARQRRSSGCHTKLACPERPCCRIHVGAKQHDGVGFSPL